MRLTFWNERKGHFDWHCENNEIADKLAAYEDTGYSPIEIKSLEGEWNAMRKVVDSYRKAEEQGRLVRLPCKVGDEGRTMYEELVEALRLCVKYGKAEDALANAQKAADAIESLKHTVEILCGVKINLVRCCECVYHDDESQYHYCRKWGRNCPNDSDFFCKWGRRKDGGQDNV